jgi:hypothetical protein
VGLCRILRRMLAWREIWRGRDRNEPTAILGFGPSAFPLATIWAMEGIGGCVGAHSLWWLGLILG